MESTVGHKKAITGVSSDITNRYVISSSVDRTIKVSAVLHHHHDKQYVTFLLPNP